MTLIRRARGRGARRGLAIALGLGALVLAAPALAHNIGGSDAAFVAATRGPDPLPFMYLGAKHMVTGYDHLLFLVGVIFFLFRFRDIALYVSLFSLGHSITLLAGVYFKLQVDPHLVDAVIGLSVAYKAFDNLSGFKTLVGVQPDPRLAVFGFGLIHGFGLATKLQALNLNKDGLLANLVAFNVGVEIGQVIALSIILVAMTLWRRSRAFEPTAAWANVLLMLAGFVLAGQQIAGYVLGGAVT
ncbi:MAG: HupE/UreJ family protein [Phenylobacterium sp.]